MTSLNIGSKTTIDDVEAVQQTALDYVQSWYEGNAELMRGCLHPSLVKRALKQDLPNGESFLNYLTREEMVAATAAGGGTRVPSEERVYTITILDIYEEIATVRADNPHWIDYLHMVKQEGKWVIVNVLYTANRANK